MQFPKAGVVHHGSEEGKLFGWAEKNGIEMNGIKAELNDILQAITKD